MTDPRVVTHRAALQESLAPARRAGAAVALVPTMGALHAGHLSLVAAAKARCASVAASLFVNPAQFGEGEDFDGYPRGEAADLTALEEAGVDVVFAPPAADMYPAGFATTIHVGGPLAAAFEAAQRPEHFDGVALVVTKLLTIVLPDAAFFGEKDAQQLAVIRRLAADLDLPVEVVGVPTVREPTGLALSSRNAYLTPAQRAVAPDLYRALLAGARAAARPGAGPKDAIVAAAMVLVAPDAGLKDDEDRLLELKGQAPPGPPRFTIDYLAVVDADTFEQQDELTPRSLLVGAARLGTTRLIDNVPLGEHVPPRADSPPLTSAYPARDATD